jgi:hypothetical protein
MVSVHGEAYEEYRRHVPMIVPLTGRRRPEAAASRAAGKT